MGASTLSIAITGLNAAQAGLLTTSHNIANSGTEGYSRQSTVQTTQNPYYTGSGFFGQGTRVLTVARAYSSFLGTQLQSSQAATSQLATYQTQIDQIDNMLADTTVGMSPAISGFYTGVNGVSANPSSIPARQTMISAAQSMVSRFKDLSARLQEIGDGVSKQVTSEVANINSIGQELASINQRIIVAEAGNGGGAQQANDLRDQRDQLVVELNKHISSTVVEQSDGSYSVFFGNGQPLVVGTVRYQLTASPATNDPTRMVIGLKNPNGTTSSIPEDMISGGSLGGLLAFRSETLDDAQNRLGLMAMGIASAFNDQHALGQTLTGAMGGNFFNLPSTVVTADTGNTGTAAFTITLDDVSAMQPSDYTLDYTAGGYTLRRLSDNTTLFSNATLPQTIDGLTITASGAPVAGDSFKLQPTRYAARDISVAITDARDIAAASPITTTTATANIGTAVISAGSVIDPIASVPSYTLNYDLASNELRGFPNGTVLNVTVNGTTTPYTIGGAVTGIPYTNGMSVTVDSDADGTQDIQFGFTGTPKQGDTFTIGQSALNTNDNRNALALAAVQTKKVLLGGTANVESSYAQMVSLIGNRAREIDVNFQSQSSLLEQAQASVAAFSGVNMDEEGANLLRFQQAYQASAKVIDISGKLFDLLTSLGS